jgi:hypothetical protein
VSEPGLHVLLRRVLNGPTGVSSAGYPYLERAGFELFRDRVPHLLADGTRVLDALDDIEVAGESAERAARVVRQVVRTAAITAPPDLWLLRHVLGALAEVGMVERLLRGEAVVPEESGLDARELRIDLRLLCGRGYVVRDGDAFFAASGRVARAALAAARPVEGSCGLATVWAAAFRGEREAPAFGALPDAASRGDTWVAGPNQVELGARLLPLVVGLASAGVDDPSGCAPAIEILEAAGLWRDGAPTLLGRRVLRRGAGPYGIIEAYHPYLDRLVELLRRGRKDVHVSRGANVAASQRANQAAFARANDSLDAYCAQTGFTYDVFIEHALGRGEATRQRYERSGDALRYFGADLEDDAIDAAQGEQRAGRLPAEMRFVRAADIGEPSVVVDAVRAARCRTEGAVMVVGNGFHEVRAQTDARMVEVFRGYREAGLVLLFTEETALSVEDLLETAWNTYHAGFRYVHEKSGQGLRPAHPDQRARSDTLPASWRECAERAGYEAVEAFCRRGRTVYPYPPRRGYNPAISVNYFFVPRA